MDITFHMIPHKSMLVNGFGQLDSLNYQDSLLQPEITSLMSNRRRTPNPNIPPRKARKLHFDIPKFKFL